MKVLIIGSSGQLGKSLIENLPSYLKNNINDLLVPNRKEFDLANLDFCRCYIHHHRPKWIINAAAYTNVDKAESDNDIAYRVNALAPAALAEVIAEYNGNILQISSDYVFDGSLSRPYRINDKPSPLSFYGESKASAEEAIKKILFPMGRGQILRTSWLIGPGENSFTSKMLKLFHKKNEVGVISDQIGCTTSVINLASACWRVLEYIEEGRSISNVLHWSDSGVASWFDVAQEVYRVGNELNLLDSSCKIHPIKTDQYKSVAKRPGFSLLDISDTQKQLNLKPVYWRHSLYEILILYKQQLI